MGICKYCGKPAGFLRSKHAECEQEHQEHLRTIEKGKRLMLEKLRGALDGHGTFEELETAIGAIEETYSVPRSERTDMLVRAWQAAVDRFLEDGVLDEGEEERLGEVKRRFGLSQSDLDSNGALTKTVKAVILRDVLNGVVPQRMEIDGSLPINFQKGEQIVWAFAGSEYLEDKTRRKYVGGSQGVSLRIMKGAYYRVGAFKGNAIDYTERVPVDTGWVVLTNRNIYFAGPKKSLRIPYDKIVSFQAFSDGVGILRDAATAKPQIFVTGDGWFTYNLVANLSQL